MLYILPQKSHKMCYVVYRARQAVRWPCVGRVEWWKAVSREREPVNSKIWVQFVAGQRLMTGRGY